MIHFQRQKEVNVVVAFTSIAGQVVARMLRPAIQSDTQTRLEVNIDFHPDLEVNGVVNIHFHLFRVP